MIPSPVTFMPRVADKTKVVIRFVRESRICTGRGKLMMSEQTAKRGGESHYLFLLRLSRNDHSSPVVFHKVIRDDSKEAISYDVFTPYACVRQLLTKRYRLGETIGAWNDLLGEVGLKDRVP